MTYIYAFEHMNYSELKAFAFFDEDHLAEAFEKRNENGGIQPKFPFFAVRRYELNNPTALAIDVLVINVETAKFVTVGDDPVLKTFPWDKMGLPDPTSPEVVEAKKEPKTLKESGKSLNLT